MEIVICFLLSGIVLSSGVFYTCFIRNEFKNNKKDNKRGNKL